MSNDSDSIQSIKEWNDRAKELASDTKDLAEIAEAAKMASRMGKMAGALGIASVGLDIALSFIDTGPSDTELILDAISKLSDKVDKLWAAMDEEFDLQDQRNNWRACSTTMKKVFDDAWELERQLFDYSKAKDVGDQAALDGIAREYLRMFHRGKLEEMLKTLSDQATGTALNTSVLAASYEYRHGDISQITMLSMQMIQSYKTCIAGLMVYYQLEHAAGPHGEVMPAEEYAEKAREVSSAFQAGLEALTKAMGDYTSACRANVLSLLEQKIDSLMLTHGVDTSSGAACEAAAHTIFSALADQFFWLNFGVLVYSPMQDGAEPVWMDQAFTGVRYHSRLGHAWKGGTTASMMIYHCEQGRNVSVTDWNFDIDGENPQTLVKDLVARGHVLSKDGMIMVVRSKASWGYWRNCEVSVTHSGDGFPFNMVAFW